MKMILTSVPDDLLRGLPAEDQVAIQAAVGQPVELVEGDDRGFPRMISKRVIRWPIWLRSNGKTLREVATRYGLIPHVSRRCDSRARP